MQSQATTEMKHPTYLSFAKIRSNNLYVQKYRYQAARLLCMRVHDMTYLSSETNLCRCQLGRARLKLSFALHRECLDTLLALIADASGVATTLHMPFCIRKQVVHSSQAVMTQRAFSDSVPEACCALIVYFN